MKTAIKLYIILLCVGYSNLFAQNYEISTKQRRLRDHIAVEFWAKSLKTPNEAIGSLNLRLNYNNEFLQVNSTQFNSTITDSVSNNFFVNPYITINSAFSNQNNFGSISVINDTESAGINLTLQSFGSGGVIPSPNNKGSYIGRVVFRIVGNVNSTAATALKWSTSTNQTSVIKNFLGDDITSDVRFVSPSSFRIEGVTFLAPNKDGLVLDRDETYTGFSTIFQTIGYPIFFERSMSTSKFNAPIDEDIAFVFEYDAGNGWEEIGRVVETSNRSQILTPNYSSGNLGLPASSSGNMITAAEGLTINSANYRQPLRVFWKRPNDFRERFESVKLRVSLLDGTIQENISQRTKLGGVSESNFEYPTGNYFFTNLDGRNQYLKTISSFSNPTQITISAWVNPDKYGSGDVGIVSSSAGPNAPLINGLQEGAWMLYLKDGKYPAFRARDQENAGAEGYFVNLVSDEPIKISEYSDEINDHSKNWTHISVTLNNNTSKIYVDGELVVQQEGSINTSERLLSSNHPIWVGVNPNGKSLSSYFSGGIKEVQVWRKELSQSEIRFYSNSVNQPSNFEEINLPDNRSSLDLYYKLTGNLLDYATKDPWQNGQNNLMFYEAETNKEFVPYLPDLPHLKITSPLPNAGLVNNSEQRYLIRYLGYGIGNPVDFFTRDINIQYSIDGGSTWNFIRDEQGVEIGGQNATSIEAGQKIWFPYLNNNASGNLRSGSPFEKNILLRITGSTQFSQTTISSDLVPIKVSRYMSMKRASDTKLRLSDHGSTSIPKDGLYFSSWIRPYSFPSEDEGLFPLVARVDSVNSNIEYKFSLTEKRDFAF
ncbi:LamG domain-containing protein [Candidatus Kapabacteria bacterium]|nr:LamG domain-containing protein [Candidatus Kapabacteria bacterium]